MKPSDLLNKRFKLKGKTPTPKQNPTLLKKLKKRGKKQLFTPEEQRARKQYLEELEVRERYND